MLAGLPGRVVSVSPRLAHAEAEEPLANDNLRFPVVEMIRADHRAADALVSLIEMSRQTAMGLRELIEQGRNSERKSARSALHLQERLRLSARMLQAFQAQISRVEKGLMELREHEKIMQSSQEQLSQQLANLKSQSETLIVDVQQRMADAAQSALAEFQSRLHQKAHQSG